MNQIAILPPKKKALIFGSIILSVTFHISVFLLLNYKGEAKPDPYTFTEEVVLCKSSEDGKQIRISTGSIDGYQAYAVQLQDFDDLDGGFFYIEDKDAYAHFSESFDHNCAKRESGIIDSVMIFAAKAAFEKFGCWQDKNGSSIYLVNIADDNITLIFHTNATPYDILINALGLLESLNGLLSQNS